MLLVEEAKGCRVGMGRLLSTGATCMLPQVKSVKPCLKQLQQCIQTISTLHDDEILPSNPADLFHWLPKEHMCVLVYLVSSHWSLVGDKERAPLTLACWSSC